MNDRLFWNFNDKISGNYMWYSTSILPLSLNYEDLRKVSRNKDHYFLQFNFSKNKIQEHQGFKIHISATIKNYEQILDIIFNFCKKNNITFKYIANKYELEKNFSGLCSFWSTGKFITIYPQPGDFRSIVSKLYSLHELKELKGIYILTDRRYKDSNVIFYRYGILNNDSNKCIFDPNGKYLYTDYSIAKYQLPYFVNEPFPINKDEVSPHSKYLFLKYTPIRNIYKKSSGSVYCVKSNNGDTYILKNARPNFSDGNSTQIERLKNEKIKLKKLIDFNFFPHVVESFIENDNYFLVETLVTGVTVNKFRAEDLSGYATDTQILPKSFKVLEIIKDMCRKLLALHKKDIFLGDISANNILVNEKTSTINFVDVEQTEFNVSKKKISCFFRTTGFFDKKTATLPPLQQDIQQLGYVIMSLFCRANSFLEIDSSGKTTISFFKEFAKIYHIPKALVEIPLTLIRNPRESSLKSVLNVKLILDFESDKEKICTFPEDLLLKLRHTYFCGKLDNICSQDIEQISFFNKEDVLYTDKILNLNMRYLENKNTNSISQESKNAINLAKKELVNCFSNAIKSELESRDLSIFLSVLNCYFFANNFDINTQKEKEDIETIIDYLLTNYKVVNNGLVGFRKSKKSVYIMPYISSGTAGILIVLLFYKYISGTDKYDEIIKTIAYGFKLTTLPKSGGFANGLSGIVYALLLYRKVTDDSKIDNLTKKMINELHMYTIYLSNNLYVISDDFKHVSLDFVDGNLGMIKVLEKAKKVLNWES
jgi:serine/threonine protein kinase